MQESTEPHLTIGQPRDKDCQSCPLRDVESIGAVDRPAHFQAGDKGERCGRPSIRARPGGEAVHVWQYTPQTSVNDLHQGNL